MKGTKGREGQREREYNWGWKKEDTRELQPSALGNSDGLRWCICRVWVSIFKDTMCFIQLCHPSPLKGKPFHSFPHIPSQCHHLRFPKRQLLHPKDVIMIDDPDMKSSKTRKKKKWSTIFVLIQHPIDHVRNYIHPVILSQRWYCVYLGKRMR